ncbi:hypothetical protein MRX96_000811, partial [Rhipicephalus microplus]
MAGDLADANDSISPLVGLVYIFNLIVGTGALTMPAAFKDAGWLLSLIIVVVLAFMSYLTTTFVIEAMASANALVHWKTLQHYKRVVDEEESTITQAKQDDMVVSRSLLHMVASCIAVATSLSTQRRTLSKIVQHR